MCLAMYLFSKETIEDVAWNPETPGLYSHALTTRDLGALTAWNPQNLQACYLGSHQGCGCGWSPAWENDSVEERACKLADRQKLMAVLTMIDLKNAWLITCWEGDQGFELHDTRTVHLAEIANPEFEFAELVRYRIIA